MKKAISVILTLLVIMTFAAALMAEEGKKAEKVARVKGTIVAVEEKEGVTSLTIQLKKGEAITFQLADACKIKMGKKDIAIADIKPEMRARVTYYNDDDMLIATKIKLSRPKLAKKK